MRFSPRSPVIAALSALGLMFASAAAQPPAPAPVTPVAPPPSAPPLPFKVVPALDGLRFDQPLAIVTPPGETNRLFILEKPGRIIVIPDLAKPARETFLDLTAEVGNTDVENGLLALAFHPDYKKNRQFYLWLTVASATAGRRESHDRLARFTIAADNPNRADSGSEQPLFSQLDRAPNHNGGELLFGPDGYLYLTIGDEGGANDQYHNSQRIDHNFFSCILRLDVDRRPGSLPPNPHPAVNAGTYTIPPDNPYVNAKEFNGAPVDPAQVRTEFWAVGLRNAWRTSFDPVTGLLWAGDVGQDRVEEVDIIRRGENYGWNYREGDEAFQIRGTVVRTPPAGVTFAEPLFTYRHPNTPGVTADSGNCIIGGFVYRGSALPALTGHYLFADYVSGWIWALSPVDGKGSKVTVEKIARRVGLVSFGLDPRTGDVLMANIATGNIEKLIPNPAAETK